MHKYPLLYKSVVYKHTKHKLTNMAKTHAHKIVCTHTHTHTHTHRGLHAHNANRKAQAHACMHMHTDMAEEDMGHACVCV